MSDRWLHNRELLSTTGAHGVDRFPVDDRHGGNLVRAAEAAVGPDRRDGPRPALRGGTGVQALAQPRLRRWPVCAAPVVTVADLPRHPTTVAAGAMHRLVPPTTVCRGRPDVGRSADATRRHEGGTHPLGDPPK